MRYIALIILFLLPATLSAHPQETAVNGREGSRQDSTTKRIVFDNSRKKQFFEIGQEAVRKGSPTSRYLAFKGHWNGFQTGWADFAELPEGMEDMELDRGRSFTLHFNFGRKDFNLVRSNNLGLVMGLGLEYQRLRFHDKNVTIAKDGDGLAILKGQAGEGADIKRSCFKALYLNVPLLMEWQFPVHQIRRAYVSAGIVGGVRMHSKTKIVYDDSEGHKHRLRDKGKFNMVPVKADLVGRIGYRSLCFWGSYTLTPMFKGEIPDMHLYTIGMGFSF